MDIGELIRELRTAHGWSQARLADEINARHGTTLTREYVARWERGKVAPRGFYLAALSSVLDVPLAVLEDPMMRRAFLTDVAGTAIAPVIASDLLAKGFAARLTGEPTAEAWEAKLAAYGSDYMSMGAADIQRRVAGELVVIQAQLEQPRLWSAAARLMTLYARPSAEGAWPVPPGRRPLAAPRSLASRAGSRLQGHSAGRHRVAMRSHPAGPVSFPAFRAAVSARARAFAAALPASFRRVGRICARRAQRLQPLPRSPQPAPLRLAVAFSPSAPSRSSSLCRATSTWS
ncbi:multiprotein-bridging factor 1 family protein [Streptomyces lavendulae]|uniref:helix-turn-helix domain-containing protein n=1 Tax=Streptomyces lavendulae TaxID=1914 RepID=UPI0036A38A00